jgi:hypothetical protein
MAQILPSGECHMLARLDFRSSADRCACRGNKLHASTYDRIVGQYLWELTSRKALSGVGFR